MTTIIKLQITMVVGFFLLGECPNWKLFIFTSKTPTVKSRRIRNRDDSFSKFFLFCFFLKKTMFMFCTVSCFKLLACLYHFICDDASLTYFWYCFFTDPITYFMDHGNIMMILYGNFYIILAYFREVPILQFKTPLNPFYSWIWPPHDVTFIFWCKKVWGQNSLLLPQGP